MANASNYTIGQVAEHQFGSSTWTKPSAIYIALYTVLQNAAGTSGTEVSTSGTAYVRQNLPPSDSNWTISGGTVSNTSAVTWPAATGSGFGTIVGVALYDAVTGGNEQYFMPLTASKTIGATDIASFPAGSIQFTIS